MLEYRLRIKELRLEEEPFLQIGFDGGVFDSVDLRITVNRRAVRAVEQLRVGDLFTMKIEPVAPDPAGTG